LFWINNSSLIKHIKKLVSRDAQANGKNCPPTLMKTGAAACGNIIFGSKYLNHSIIQLLGSKGSMGFRFRGSLAMMEKYGRESKPKKSPQTISIVLITS
jgi:hypothetical protein